MSLKNLSLFFLSAFASMWMIGSAEAEARWVTKASIGGGTCSCGSFGNLCVETKTLSPGRCRVQMAESPQEAQALRNKSKCGNQQDRKIYWKGRCANQTQIDTLEARIKVVEAEAMVKCRNHAFVMTAGWGPPKYECLEGLKNPKHHLAIGKWDWPDKSKHVVVIHSRGGQPIGKTDHYYDNKLIKHGEWWPHGADNKIMINWGVGEDEDTVTIVDRNNLKIDSTSGANFNVTRQP